MDSPYDYISESIGSTSSNPDTPSSPAPKQPKQVFAKQTTRVGWLYRMAWRSFFVGLACLLLLPGVVMLIQGETVGSWASANLFAGFFCVVLISLLVTVISGVTLLVRGSGTPSKNNLPRSREVGRRDNFKRASVSFFTCLALLFLIVLLYLWWLSGEAAIQPVGLP